MFREDNPVYIKAWQTMFGYKYDDFAPEHVKELLAAKEKVKQREGDNYPNWVLDQLGIETELANRVALGRGLQPPYFRWVAFDDTLLFPLNNSSLAAQSPDRKIFFGREELLFARYVNQFSLNGVPAPCQYTAQVRDAILEFQRRTGPWPSSLRLPTCARSSSLPRKRRTPPDLCALCEGWSPRRCRL